MENILISCHLPHDIFFELALSQMIFLLAIVFQFGYFCGRMRVFHQMQKQNMKMKEEPLCLLLQKSEKEESLNEISLPLLKKKESMKSQKFPDLENNREEEQQRLSQKFLAEKISLEMKKIQTTSFFEMRLENSKNHPFMRKIQKHEIVTDYVMQNQTQNEKALSNFSSMGNFSNNNSLLEIVTYQDFKQEETHANVQKKSSTLLQKKVINLSEEKQTETFRTDRLLSHSMLENGKFVKLFKNHYLIGEGGFGKVYSAQNLYENDKLYAIKKVFLKGLLHVDHLLNEVSIISNYNHKNIIRFYTCWMELANINETMSVKQLLQIKMGLHETSKQNNILPNFEGEQISNKNKSQVDIISYFSSENSNFAFEEKSHHSKQQALKKKTSKQENHCRTNLMKNTEIKENSYKNQPSETFNLLQIYTLHIQMEFCQGGNLAFYLNHRKCLNPQNAFLIFNQILNGLEFLHAKGIVHRDLKPGNILICKLDNLVKIGDFGLSALIEDQDENFWFQKVGTPSYMAPQLTNNTNKQIKTLKSKKQSNNFKSLRKQEISLVDIYSAGVIYYEMLNLFNTCTHHERIQKLNKLKENVVELPDDHLKEERKIIKLMTKNKNRPNIKELLSRKQFIALKEKYKDSNNELIRWKDDEMK